MFSISQIRAEARQTINSTRGIFLLPVVIVVISVFVNLLNYFNQDNSYLLRASSDSTEFMNYAVGAIGFPIFYQLLISLLSLSVAYVIFQMIVHKKEQTSFQEALAIFTSPDFGKIFRTFLLKQFFLFLWGLVMFVGLVLFLTAFILTIGYTVAIGNTNPEAIPEDVLAVIGITFMLGLLLLIGGFALYIPQVYAYSQVHYILFEQLEKQEYAGASTIIKQSRQLMRGYKWKRFVLDLSFLGWFILVILSLGIVNIYVLPYYYATEVHFYFALKEDHFARHKAYMERIQQPYVSQ